ncbi:polysaccharide deacetylase family protein [Streptomyces sp. NPDC002506]|uniref:polysaccharide deacetylase family protein n=1 Tax=Streptomyces sp. NPDC002506 TaxID=3154536 RepID=UPI0033207010
MTQLGQRSGREGRIVGVAAAAVALLAIAGVLAFAEDHGSDADAKSPKTSASQNPAPPKVDPSIVHSSDRPGKSLNITIDDGPDPVWTPKVLEVLKENDVKAVFCMIGPQAKAHPDLVKKVVAAGHKLCDHTVDHNTAMDKKPEGYQSEQILDAQRMIEDAAGGAKVQYYRAPGGAFSPYSRQLAANHGMRPLGWNVDSKDFERKGANAIVKTVENEVREGRPTVLFHDGGGDRSQTVDALEELLPWMTEQGYGFGFPQR